MRIAIVGAGLAGLGAAWHLLSFPSSQVTLFDPLGPGGGASGVSTGLLHPFPGKSALFSWRADEGMKATRELIDQVETFLGVPVAERTGVLRIALSEGQRDDFFRRTVDHPGAFWLEANQVLEKVPEVTYAPALWIPGGITVYSTRYLEGLWGLCSARGAVLEKRAVQNLRELSSYDQVILAAGGELFRFPECRSLPLEPLKGQAALCRWQGPKPPCALSSLGHLTSTEDPLLYQIGSTYERGPAYPMTEEKIFLELQEKVVAFYPFARDFEKVEIKGGTRMMRLGGYRPIAMRVSSRLAVFCGLGSRGLLYHSLLGKELVEGLMREVL